MSDKEIWAAPNGAILENVHAASTCAGHPCMIHNPSDHPMVNWSYFQGRDGMIYRECLHGIGHPDPDVVAWFVRMGMPLGEGSGVCDGCCGGSCSE